MSTLICAIGNHPLEPPIDNHYAQVAGWERPGRGVNDRSGSSLVLRERTGLIACTTCVTKAQNGLAVGQESLL